MPSIIKTVGLLGVIFLLVGGTAVAWGSYQQAANPCESGYQLSIDRSQVNETSDSRYERTTFADLSAVEQRIFLEAVTDTYNLSRMYQNTSQFTNISGKIVSYRNEEYVTQTVVSGCGVQPGTYTKLGGGLATFIGLGNLIFAGVWRRFTHSS